MYLETCLLHTGVPLSANLLLEDLKHAWRLSNVAKILPRVEIQLIEKFLTMKPEGSSRPSENLTTGTQLAWITRKLSSDSLSTAEVSSVEWKENDHIRRNEKYGYGAVVANFKVIYEHSVGETLSGQILPECKSDAILHCYITQWTLSWASSISKINVNLRPIFHGLYPWRHYTLN
jgi:hypothetical protein